MAAASGNNLKGMGQQGQNDRKALDCPFLTSWQIDDQGLAAKPRNRTA